MTDESPSYHGYRFPAEIISHAVWLYHRFGLSFRDTEDLLAQRGVTVTHEMIRRWCRTFGPQCARALRRRRGRMGDTWYLDELFVIIQSRRRERQMRRFKSAAHVQRFVAVHGLVQNLFRVGRHLLAARGGSPAAFEWRCIPLDGVASRSNTAGILSRRALPNGRIAILGATRDFRHGLLGSVHHRLLRGRAFQVWNAVTCAS